MDTPDTKKLLIALPARNEAGSIKDVLTQVKSVAKKLSLFTTDIIVFDDASTDETRAHAESLSCRVHTVHKSRGLGYVFSTMTKKFLDGKYDYLVTLDADGQFDPSEIPCVLEPVTTTRADFATGSRFLPESKTTGISFIKRFGNKMGARYVSSILKEKYSDVTCGFRAYSRDAILMLHTFSDFTYTQEVFLNLGIKKLVIAEVPITTIYFANRKSKMVSSVIRYIVQSLKIILKSIIVYAPMRLFALLGNLAFLLALASGIFVIVWNHLMGEVTPYKWLGIVSVVSAIAGILMYSTGVLLQITSRIQLTIEEQLYLSKKNAR